MNSNLETRTIHTGLYGVQAKAVIDGVHGQLSDGKWENTPGYDKYWTNFAIETADDGEVVFKVNTEISTVGLLILSTSCLRQSSRSGLPPRSKRLSMMSVEIVRSLDLGTVGTLTTRLFILGMQMKSMALL